MSANPFDKNEYPSAYPPNPVGDSSYPPQNYNSDVNPWSANQANAGPVNAYSNANTSPNPYSAAVPNPYAQSPTFNPYQSPTPTRDVIPPQQGAYGGMNAYDYKEPGYAPHSPPAPKSPAPVTASTLVSKPSVSGGVPTIATSGSANPVPLAPLHTKAAPNKWRFLLRFVGLLGSIGAFGFSVGAGPHSGRPNPFSDKSAIIFLYILSAISIVVHLFFLLNMLNRRVRSGAKIPRKWLLVTDVVLAVCWGFDVAFLLAKNHCPIGTLGGWCDFFNTSIFFAFLVLAVTVLAIFWDMYGWYVERKNRLA
ncbi:hypothetical protein K7432_009160 [Basidiobolus ranarum]|uniref:MARVEL domain-containing protein n=1 Tax=Basidiobolus ranarum TaxID=34480 RepID=A0ABR2VXH8_9FUNG